jgi:hypothetical protein
MGFQRGGPLNAAPASKSGKACHHFGANGVNRASKPGIALGPIFAFSPLL